MFFFGGEGVEICVFFGNKNSGKMKIEGLERFVGVFVELIH